MIQIPDSIIKDEKEYKNKVKLYLKGKIEYEKFKPYSSAMGVYEQREKGKYMVRARIPGGVITLNQLKRIVKIANQYSEGRIHFTSRQDIQFHNVSLENTVNIIEELLEENIMTRGTGGNTPRNIGCSPLSGVDKEEVFDVTPYMEAVTSYLLKDQTVFNLPRKYKIAFSNSSKDTGNARISDLGFIAKIHEGKKGFVVYGAGGLGNAPKASIKLKDFIEDHEVLYYVQAMKELFENEGDRVNRNKARIRHILYRLGEEKFKNLFFDFLKKVKEKKNLDLYIEDTKEEKEKGKEISVDDLNIIHQKEKGLYSIYIHPENGNINIKNLNKVIEYIDNLRYIPSIRLTNTQGFYIRDIKGEDVTKLLYIVEKFSRKFPIEQSVACAGAKTCKLGLCLSQNLLSAIIKRFEKVEKEIKKEFPRMFISGCPNSCGQHQKGLIGFSGKAKRNEYGLIPMYTVFFGGNLEYGILGKAYGDIPAKKIPDFLVKLAEIKFESNIIDFMEFIQSKEKTIKGLIKKYEDIESIEDNPSLYYDFGSNTPFSLK
ncbi:nitrite/sulfite reductase [Defluviitalea phaphyphila]|uniref:nitrite/sulfite reductase n=1 Tax=Defluviitalea phaphyphila TaxID=1473580 RepID=UPI000AA2DF3D|nr:nitrite/sulfite reductase [Defluviitalea phaphyphila]